MSAQPDGHVTSVLVTLHPDRATTAGADHETCHASVRLVGDDEHVLARWSSLGVASTAAWLTGVRSRHEGVLAQFTSGDLTIVVRRASDTAVVAVFEPFVAGESSLVQLLTVDEDAVLTIVDETPAVDGAHLLAPPGHSGMCCQGPSDAGGQSPS